MAFEEVTLFEFDLEGAQFGPSELPSMGAEYAPADAEATGEAPTDDESSGTGRILALVAAALVVSVVATVLARRLSGDDGEQTTVEEFAGESVEVDDGESLT